MVVPYYGVVWICFFLISFSFDFFLSFPNNLEFFAVRFGIVTNIMIKITKRSFTTGFGCRFKKNFALGFELIPYNKIEYKPLMQLGRDNEAHHK